MGNRILGLQCRRSYSHLARYRSYCDSVEIDPWLRCIGDFLKSYETIFINPRQGGFVVLCAMQIQFWTIGKNNEPYVDPGISDFTRRINNYFPATWKIITSIKNASLHTENDLKRKEGELILKMLDPHDYLVALDENGKPFSSVQLSAFIRQRANESAKNLIFLIGGAYGLDNAIMKRANYMWSLSALTFPHQLVRLILAEQIYRACTILRNEKYHHS